MKNKLISLSENLENAGLYKESKYIMHLVKLSQASEFEMNDKQNYIKLMLELSSFLNQNGELLKKTLIGRLLSPKRSYGEIKSFLSLIELDLRRYYGFDVYEEREEDFSNKIRKIKEGLELLKDKIDLSDRNGDSCVRSNMLIYCGLSSEGISNKVGDLMLDLSREIKAKVKSLT